jgi:hypothetical protein
MNSEQDYDSLLDHLLTLVEKWLQEYDDFVPCGSSITTDSEIVGHAVAVDDSATVESAMKTLFTELREKAQEGSIRACCVCYNGELEKGGETVPAIVIILEHVLGPTTILRRPYTKGSDGIYTFGQLEGERGMPAEIFTE